MKKQPDATRLLKPKLMYRYFPKKYESMVLGLAKEMSTRDALSYLDDPDLPASARGRLMNQFLRYIEDPDDRRLFILANPDWLHRMLAMLDEKRLFTDDDILKYSRPPDGTGQSAIAEVARRLLDILPDRKHTVLASVFADPVSRARFAIDHCPGIFSVDEACTLIADIERKQQRLGSIDYMLDKIPAERHAVLGTITDPYLRALFAYNHCPGVFSVDEACALVSDISDERQADHVIELMVTNLPNLRTEILKKTISNRVRRIRFAVRRFPKLFSADDIGALTAGTMDTELLRVFRGMDKSRLRTTLKRQQQKVSRDHKQAFGRVISLLSLYPQEPTARIFRGFYQDIGSV